MGTRLIHPGKRYGRWTVIGGPVYPNSATSPSYLCRCGCGKEKPIPSGNLLKGLSTMCMVCSRLEAKRRRDERAEGMVGMVFDGATIIGADLGTARSRRLLFRCRCGIDGAILVSKFDGGRTVQCAGCAASESRGIYPRSLRVLGDIIGVTRERVRQIIRDQGIEEVYRRMERSARIVPGDELWVSFERIVP